MILSDLTLLYKVHLVAPITRVRMMRKNKAK